NGIRAKHALHACRHKSGAPGRHTGFMSGIFGQAHVLPKNNSFIKRESCWKAGFFFFGGRDSFPKTALQISFWLT
ncbi:MAG: hypothetical protein IIZ49_03070, partial [Oscillospiraceae bacterium]|nr:hypothetical protein [Oscillospiraceae bacterium]